MKLYVCKNHDMDSDVHFAVFTTQEKAEKFCRQANGFNLDEDSLYLLYWEVDLSDDVATELTKYSQRRMTA